jgi:NADH-quinone oxidoreductase subunit L
LIPVGLLAILSIFGGFLGFMFGKTALLERLLAQINFPLPTTRLTSQLFLLPETWMSIIGALIGVGTAFLIYHRYPKKLKNFPILKQAFFIDSFYWNLLAIPLISLSRFVVHFIEPQVFDGFIRLVSAFTQRLAQGMQWMQNGQIRSYAAWMIVGAICLVVFFVRNSHA